MKTVKPEGRLPRPIPEIGEIREQRFRRQAYSKKDIVAAGIAGGRIWESKRPASAVAAGFSSTKVE